jgi:hypothetical protein
MLSWIHFREKPYFTHSQPNTPVIRFQIVPSEDGRIFGGGPVAGGLAVAPDGESVAFVAYVQGKTGLWVRALDSTRARLLPGTEGAARPLWSPDSRSIAFSVGSTLQRIDLSRQMPLKICDIGGYFYGGSWLSDGRILFSNRDIGVFQVPASGGIPSRAGRTWYPNSSCPESRRTAEIRPLILFWSRPAWLRSRCLPYWRSVA